MFSVSTTHHLKIRELSDGNNDPKLIQTSALPLDPHELDDENKKLSEITQNSLHPNKLIGIWVILCLCFYKNSLEEWV